ncbi:MAG: thioredoxin family protein [Brevundimonas sp.]
MPNLIVLSIDFDKGKELLCKFGVTRQSTLSAFKSGKEIDHSIGDMSATGIESLASKAL